MNRRDFLRGVGAAIGAVVLGRVVGRDMSTKPWNDLLESDELVSCSITHGVDGNTIVQVVEKNGTTWQTEDF